MSGADPAAPRRHIPVGTSGWRYDHWRGPFYPEGITSSNYLAFYARSFETVEVNSSFHGLPTPEMVKIWPKAVAPDFRFSTKASSYITYRKKLRDPGVTTPGFLSVVALLGDNLGPIIRA
jgi:uncharacterized protein YecE (DUF72 family)